MLAAGMMDSFARLSPTQMVLLALTIAALTILLGSTRRRNRKSQRRSLPSNHDRELDQGQSATRDIENVMMELDQLSREVHSRLDTKIAKLERLIREADARIAKLGSTTRETVEGNSLDVMLDDESPDESPRRAPTLSMEHQRIYQLADEGCTPTQIAGKTARLAGEVELILSLRRARQERVAVTSVDSV